jgi:hypothetical protein
MMNGINLNDNKTNFNLNLNFEASKTDRGIEIESVDKSDRETSRLEQFTKSASQKNLIKKIPLTDRNNESSSTSINTSKFPILNTIGNTKNTRPPRNLNNKITLDNFIKLKTSNNLINSLNLKFKINPRLTPQLTPKFTNMIQTSNSTP